MTPNSGLWTRLTRVETGVDAGTAMRLSRFAGSNLLAGCLATALGLGAILLAPEQGPRLWVALLWLATPILFAFLPRLLPRPVLCQLAALVNLAGIVTFLVLMTGGLRSFLLPWFIVLPVEAAVSGNRRLIAAGVLLSALGLAAVALLERAGIAPLPLLPVLDGDTLYPLLGVAGAGLYAAGLALTIESLSSEANASIRAGEARYRLLAEHAGDLITRHAPDGRIAFASPAALRVTGHEAFRLTGLHPTAIAHPEDRDEVMFAFLRASKLGEEGLAVWRLIKTDGAALWVETSCRPAPGIGLPREIIAVTRDISARKAAEDALLAARDAADEANRAKSRFLANMSHELRTPLNAIIGFSDMMRQELFGPLGAPRYRDYADHVHDSGHLLLDLINDVLDMAKIEAGKRDLKPERFAADEAVRRALAVVRPLAEARGLSLSADVAAMPPIVTDRRALQQILLNLLSNAIKFTAEGGRVGVRVSDDGQRVSFAVRDTGIGIAADELPRLGRPFEQIDGDYSRAHEGTGLGLALVKSLTEMQGGTLRIDSTPGQGTCVTVCLPRSATAIADEPVPEAFRGAA